MSANDAEHRRAFAVGESLENAAPDLLAACEAALPEIGGHSTMYCNLRDSLCTRCRLRAQLRAAIEKAKG
mgnify:CR=1 FL=1